MSDRAFDVVLFGATGFTGQLVAEYMVQREGTALRWAIAGRSKDKLERVKTSLGRDVPILVGDSSDEEAMTRIARDAKVVCTTVGPYVKYGRALAHACAREGAHYTDLTGEVPFMRASIDENDAAAKTSKAKIVHACGFDSVPSDLGVYMCFLRAKEEGLTLGETTLLVRRASGGFSGGTIATMAEITDSARKDRNVRKLVANPHALEAEPPATRDRRDQFTVKWEADLGAWTAPFVMAMANTRVVRRSNALFEHAYGPEFRYREVMSFKKGALGAAMASAVAGVTAGFGAAMTTPVLRDLVMKRLPKPGEGPSEETRKKGSFRIDVVAKTFTKTGAPGPRVTTRIDGEGDPGYGATARMLSEATLCLAQDSLPERYGVLTPAFALGEKFVARLNAARVKFDTTVG